MQPPPAPPRPRQRPRRSVAVPTEMMSGLPVPATCAISGRSTISNDAILYSGTPRPSRNSTAVSSNGVLKASMPSSLARSNTGCVPLPRRVRLLVQLVQAARAGNGAPELDPGLARHVGGLEGETVGGYRRGRHRPGSPSSGRRRARAGPAAEVPGGSASVAVRLPSAAVPLVAPDLPVHVDDVVVGHGRADAPR